MGKVAFTAAVKRFIVEKVSSGLDVAQVCAKWPDRVPKPESIYAKSSTDESFKDSMNEAYFSLYMCRLAELDSLSGQLATEVYPEASDWRVAEAALKRRIDVLKFSVGKMAPILAKRFDKVSKVEHLGDISPKVLAINYYAPEVSGESSVLIDHES